MGNNRVQWCHYIVYRSFFRMKLSVIVAFSEETR